MNFISYVFFGLCTTAINVVVYHFCYQLCNFPNVASTIIAWIIAVLFAFVTNKIWVFNSRSLQYRIVICEAAKFFVCRLLTGILDVVVMYFTVDLMGWMPILWKILSNGIVIILNYIASKFYIFQLRRDVYEK